MAKEDFEFYKFPGVDYNFVLPSPASDPYSRAYEVSSIPNLALDGILKIVEEAGASELTTREATAEETRGYFFKTMLKDQDTVIRQKANITVQLEKDNDYWSASLMKVSDVLSSRPGALSIEPQDEPYNDRNYDRPVAYREFKAIESDVSIMDENEVPKNATIRVRQFVPIRAFGWLPGPWRKSKSGADLLPTYSPRPINIGVVQLIDIKGINPDVSD